MKRFSIIISILAFCAISAYGGMDDVTYTMPASTGTTVNTKTYVLRGEVQSVHLDITSGMTGSVYVADEHGQLIISAAGVTADTIYYPRIAGQTTLGAAWTYTATSTNGSEAFTYTSVLAEKIAVAGEVTAVFSNEIPIAVTNTPVITIILSK